MDTVARRYSFGAWVEPWLSVAWPRTMPLRRCFSKSVDEGCELHTPRIGTIKSDLAVSGLISIRHSQELLAPEDVGRNGRGQRVELWQWGPGLSRTLMAQ